MVIVSMFNQRGYVEINEVENLNENDKIIRIIPENHKNFNCDEQYIILSSENVMYLSEGDTIVIYDKAGSTYWHELKFDDKHKLLYYKDGYDINYALKRYEKVYVRNDFFIPNYSKERNAI